MQPASRLNKFWRCKADLNNNLRYAYHWRNGTRMTRIEADGRGFFQWAVALSRSDSINDYPQQVRGWAVLVCHDSSATIMESLRDRGQPPI